MALVTEMLVLNLLHQFFIARALFLADEYKARSQHIKETERGSAGAAEGEADHPAGVCSSSSQEAEAGV